MKPNQNHQPLQNLPPTRTLTRATRRRHLPDQFDHVKAAILSQFQEELGVEQHLLRLAINEAAALAWQTGYPGLFFPALAAEKAQALAKWDRHQRSLPGTSELLALAA